MKSNASKVGQAITALLLIAALSLTVNAEVQGSTGTEWADSLVNAGSGEVQTSMAHPLGWLIALVVKNPKVYPMSQASAVIKILLPVIQSILTPLWEMLILVNGIYFIWGARDPASRNAAKHRMTNLIIGMILCGLAAPIFQLILEVEATLARQVLSAASISTAELVGGYLAGAAIITIVVLILVKLIAVSWGTAICPIIVIMAMPFIALGLRYVAVICFALLFPVMIFLYFFDFTKKLGAKLFRTAMMWVSIPIVQAVFIVVMLEGVKQTERMHLMGGFIALACFVLIGAAPFMMEGLMGGLGGALIHSGYTTSNPRLVMLGSAISGQGPAAFTQFAWYANMGMASPAGGEFVERARASQVADGKSGVDASPAFPAASGGMKRDSIRQERSDLAGRIKAKEGELASARASAAAGGGSPSTVDRLEREINTLKETRNIAGIAPISASERRAAESAKSFEELKGILDREQMRRFLKEQDIARAHGMPIKGPDLSQHRGKIMLAALTAPFSPGELLRPAGAFLGGLMTHIISDQMPLGRSLMGLCNKMIPQVSYVERDGKKVPQVRTEWQTWKDVAKGPMGKAAVFGAGVSLLAVLGMPVLAATAALGLTVAGVKQAVGRDEEVRKKISELDKSPTKLKEIRDLAKKKQTAPTTLTSDEKKRIGKIEGEFGMSIDKVLQRHEIGKLAPTTDIEKLVGKASAAGGNVAATDPDKARIDQIRDAFGLSRAASPVSDQTALETIRDNMVNPERKKLRSQEIRSLNSDDGVKKLLALDGDPAAARERERLGAIFGVNTTAAGANVAREIAGSSPEIQERMRRYRQDRETDFAQTSDIATSGSSSRQLLEDSAAGGRANQAELARDEALLGYAHDPQKRDQLRSDATYAGAVRGTPLEAAYGHDLDAFGIARDDPTAMQQLHDKVYGTGGLGISASDDHKAYGRFLTMRGKEQRSEPLTESERVEARDLESYLRMRDSKRARELEDTVEFRRGDMAGSQRATESLMFSDYAVDKDIPGTTTGRLTQLETDMAAHGGGPMNAALVGRYGAQMQQLDIDPTSATALKDFHERVTGSKQVRDKREIDRINSIVP